MASDLLQSALEYTNHRGWSVIPISKDSKKPLIEWKDFQSRIASDEEITAWFDKWPDANVGIVTGTISGLVVIDVEAGGSIQGWPLTLIAKTQRGGWHYYYAHPGARKLKNAVRIRELTDIRADGGYVIAPPSIGQYGAYEWAISPDEQTLSPTPPDLIEELDTALNPKPPLDVERLKAGAPAGERNASAAQMVGYILAALPMTLWDSIGWGGLAEWNKNNTPPLSSTELRAVFDSIVKREEAERSDERKVMLDGIQDEMWENFKVHGGKKTGEAILLKTSHGPISLTSDDLFLQHRFRTTIFKAVGIILEARKSKEWNAWLQIIASSLEMQPEEDESFTVIRQALDEMVDNAEKEDLGFLRKGIPVKYKDGILFRFDDFVDLVSRRKMLLVKRSSIRIALKELNVDLSHRVRSGKQQLRVCFFKAEQSDADGSEE